MKKGKRTQARTSRVAGALVLAVLLQAQGLQGAPQGSTGPWSAVTYTEKAVGRTDRPLLRNKRTTSYGIDTNSSVDINIDTPGLRGHLSPSLQNSDLSREVTDLNRRLESLTQTASHLGEALNSVKTAVDNFDKAEASGNSQDQRFTQSARQMADKMLEVLTELKEAIRLRLIAEGKSDDQAERNSQEAFDTALSPPLDFGYNWAVLRQMFQNEIEASERSLDALTSNLGSRIEIQAHLFKSGGEAFAISLPGYNEVVTGQRTVFEKVNFQMSPEEKRLFHNLQKLAQEVGNVNNIAEAFWTALKVDAQRYSNKLEPIKQAFHSAQDSLEKLADWAAPDKLEAWLTDDLKGQLEQTAAGKQVLKEWSDVGTVIEKVKGDVEVVKNFANLRLAFARMSPDQAMSSILGTLRAVPLASDVKDLDVLKILYPQRWKQRVDKLITFIDAAKALPEEVLNALKSANGPYSDVLAAKDSITALIENLNNLGDDVHKWLAQLSGGERPMREATNLPRPEGQKRPKIKENIGTSFDLTTVRQGRDKDDEIQVQYFFYQGDSDEPVPGTGWKDRFIIRVFGWQDKILASLVFTDQNGQSKLKPTAALSWILSRNQWPTGDESGLGGQGFRWFSGWGFSTMPLDFDEQETVELGVAGTVSLLNDRLLFGYGANLQAQQNRGFWFFSFQLFSGRGFTHRDR